MQTHGYLIVDKQKVLVLVRDKKHSRTLKLRLSGLDGTFFKDESYFLTENEMIFNQLLAGRVIDI